MKITVESMRRGLDIAASWGKLEYTGWEDENVSWKEDVYLGDWSYLDELRVSGRDALDFFSAYAVNSFERFSVGQAKHAIFCNQNGKVIGEGVLTREGENDYLFNARGPVSTWLLFNHKRNSFNSDINLKISEFKFQVSGPKSIALLQELVDTDEFLSTKFMHVAYSSIQGIPVRFIRQGMAGELGFELQGPGDRAAEVRGRILELGSKYNLRRMGARTAMVNHLEAGFPTVTHDYLPAITEEAESQYFDEYNIPVYDDTSPEWYQSFQRCMKVKGSFEGTDPSDWFRSPIELGWTANVKFDHDFYGRRALEAEKANPNRKICTLIWDKDDVTDVYRSLLYDAEPYDHMDMPRSQWFAMYTSSVIFGGNEVGSTTSRGFSYYFREMLSHGVLDVAHTSPGEEVQVVWGDPGHRQKKVRALVHSYPYKADNRRSNIAPAAGLVT